MSSQGEASALGSGQEDLAACRRRIAELEERLAAQARQRAELVHLVSHELRTPITVISGFARMLLQERAGPLGAEQRRFVDECLKACRCLDRFVEDLLEASPAAGTPLSVHPEPGDLVAAVRALVESLGPVLAERDQALDLRLDPLPELDFDRRRLEQVLTNLLNNAVRYGRAGGMIRIVTRVVASEPGQAGSADSWVEVAVEDDGPGIPAADRERLFQPYVRGVQHGDGDGLGIGLAICRRVIDAHGGTIGVEPSVLGGARFVFRLPRAGDRRGED